MRKRERDDVAAAARRRLEVLSAELSDLHPAAGSSQDRWSPGPPSPASAGPTAPVQDSAREPVQGRKPPGPGGLARPPRRPPVPPGPGGPSPRPGEPRVPRPREPRRPPPGTDPDDPVEPLGPDTGKPEDRGWSFLEEPDPVLAGAPAGLLDARAVIHTPVGRPLPPDPVRVPPPGRHAVAHGTRGGSMSDWVDERLPAAVRGRVSLTGQHVKVLSGILGIALVLAGWLALRGGSQSEAVPRATYVAQQGGASGAPPSASGTAATAARAGTTTGTDDSLTMVGATGGTGDVVVDVVGKVRRPGIVALPSGSRVNDAVLKAGGLRPGAHTAGLNLARVLVDGEQIVVGRPAPATPGAAVPGAASTTPPTGSESAGTGALVNLNTADLTQLDTLPGVGPVTAQKILDWRTAHGAFSSVDELLEVDGIGDKTLADIAPRATL